MDGSVPSSFMRPSGLLPLPPLVPSKGSEAVTKLVEYLTGTVKDQNRFSPPPWVILPLRAHHFNELERRLAEDSVLNTISSCRLRMDLDYSKNRVTLRMPTPLHEAFSRRAIATIQQLLSPATLGDSCPAQLSNMLQQVDSFGSPTLRLGTSRHEPDETLCHPQAPITTFVMEVSHAQKRRALKYLAYDYIVRSGGLIHAMLGLDLEYRGSKAATVSLWRVARDTLEDGRPLLKHEKVLSEQAFRDDSGALVDGCVTFLPSDFLDDAVTQGMPGVDTPIVLTHRALYTALSKAEEVCESLKRKALTIQAPPAGYAVEESPVHTSPEETASSDE